MDQTAVVIAVDESLSTVADLQHYLVCGVVMPDTWTAANLTFEGAGTDADGGPGAFYPIFDDAGVEYEVVADAATVIQIDPVKLAGVRWLKVRSGTSGTPVDQLLADRTVQLVLRTG
jgi:hypothetical protein